MRYTKKLGEDGWAATCIPDDTSQETLDTIDAVMQAAYDMLKEKKYPFCPACDFNYDSCTCEFEEENDRTKNADV